jgi:hypothetical protein
MSLTNMPDEFIQREVPLIVTDETGIRHLIGRAVVLNREGGLTAYFDQNPEKDKLVRKVIQAITKGVISSLSIAPTPENEHILEERE